MITKNSELLKFSDEAILVILPESAVSLQKFRNC